MWKEVYCGLAVGEQLRLGEYDRRQADSGDDFASAGHGRCEFLKLFIVPEEIRHRRATADYQCGVIVNFGVGNRDVGLHRASPHAAADARYRRGDHHLRAFILEDFLGFEKFFIPELGIRNHH